MEAVEAGRAGLAVARRHQNSRPARLAHRMLGDVVEISRRGVRHPRRRHRSRLSASRRRNRPIALRFPYAGDGELLDAQRLPAGRRREDVEVARQLRDHSRVAAGLAGRCRASGDAAEPLSPADQLDAHRLARGAEDARSLVRARPAMPRPAISAPMRSTRSPTISIRRRHSPPCTNCAAKRRRGQSPRPPA